MIRRFARDGLCLSLVLAAGCGGAGWMDTRAERSPAVAEPPSFDTLRVVNGRPFADLYFQHFGVNPTIDTAEERFSTFSVDVDTASYGLVRGYLERGALPDEAAVRVEELVNAFDYDYAPPDDAAFSVHAEAFPSPNRTGYHVLHLGLKGREVRAADREPSNLVFVIDVSGSMNLGNRLGRVKQALRLLVDQLDPRDTVGVVVYGDSAEVVLEPTPGLRRAAILEGIDALQPGGSTHAQAGLVLGYELAARHFVEGGINRVILCSDGVANNGITDADGIFETVQDQARGGVAITTVGFGMGNYNDVLMERLAQRGDGNYFYVDREADARRVFVEQLTGTLQTIARDVKIQVEWDAEAVARYRLLGYENRRLERHEFADDRVDAGEIGAGHAVTAIYEVKFRRPPTGPFGTLRVRYKAPEGGPSRLLEKALPAEIVRADFTQVAGFTRLSMVVAAFAEKLRGSYWVRNLGYDALLRQLDALPGGLRDREDVRGLRDLIVRARSLDRRGDKFERDLPLARMDFDHVPILR